VQGRKSRFRSPDDLDKIVRENYAQGIKRFFITDDNFARNRDWELLFDRLIALRAGDCPKIGFTIQVDTLCHKITNFIENAPGANVGSNAHHPLSAFRRGRRRGRGASDPRGDQAEDRKVGRPSSNRSWLLWRNMRAVESFVSVVDDSRSMSYLAKLFQCDEHGVADLISTLRRAQRQFFIPVNDYSGLQQHGGGGAEF
jgi:hypothetical protein